MIYFCMREIFWRGQFCKSKLYPEQQLSQDLASGNIFLRTSFHK